MDNNIKIKAVIFDLDGTIYSKKKLKLFFVHRFIRQLRTFTNYLNIRKKMGEMEFENQNMFNDYVLGELCKQSSKSEDYCKAFLAKFKTEFISILKRYYKAETQIIEAINYFSEQNIPIACLSDYAFVEERLLALDIDITKFKLIKSSEDYGALKPSPKSFLAIAKAFNVSPEHVLVIGDRNDTDGMGAKASNMQFIKYPENYQTLNQIITNAQS